MSGERKSKTAQNVPLSAQEQKEREHEIKQQLRQDLLEIQEQRNRTHRKPLTYQQRCVILNEIYDSTLHWLKAAAMTGTAKGTAAAAILLERSRVEVDELIRTQGPKPQESEDTEVTIGYELTLPGKSEPASA